MSRNDKQTEGDSPASPASPSKKHRPAWWRRALRTTTIVVASVAALALISTLLNAGFTNSEKSSVTPYGQRVAIDAGDLNVYRNGGSGPTMVLFSGYGTAAPAIDFAPPIRKLDAFDVIVVEGFGYGYSDLNVTDRTIENITSEVHEALNLLGVRSAVTLVGHSIGGLYTRHYANAYPDEVSAIIGIDPMTATTSTLEVGTASTTEGALDALGVVRWATAIVPGMVRPAGTAFTDDELARIARMTTWNYGNASVADEWAHLAANSTKANAQPIAADVPVLEILSSESVTSIPGWLENHEAELASVATHQLEVLDGAHYLHWTQAPAMARLITAFIAAHVAH